MIRLRAANAKKHTVGSLATFSNEHRWMLDGACVDLSPQHADMLFFPTQGLSADPARELCDTCPVLATCRAYGIANPHDQGIWGGLTQKQRRRQAVASNLLDAQRRRTKGVNLNSRIAEELRIMAATGVTVADAMAHVGWPNTDAMRQGMYRYGLSDTWAQLRRNSHTLGVRVDGAPPREGRNGGALNDAGQANRQQRRNAA